jgi:hypothetical protein
VSRDGVGVPYPWSRAMAGCGSSVALALSSTCPAAIPVVRSALAWQLWAWERRNPPGSRSEPEPPLLSARQADHRSRPSGWMPLGELASAQPQDDSTKRDRDDHRSRREWGHSHVRHPCSFVVPGPPWVVWSVFAVVYLVCAPGALWKGQPGTAAPYLAFSCCWGAVAWLSRKSGVELTAESVVVRRLSRRRIAWSHVQAVVCHKSSGGSSAVRLLLQDGKPVKLPAPGGTDAAAFERDFHNIDAW